MEFKLGKSINNNSVLFSPADSYNAFKDINGNFILNAQMLVPNGPSPNGFYTLLYSFSYNSNFDSLNWAINLSESTDDIEQRYAVYSTDYDIESNSFCVIGSKLNQEFNDSFISKLTINGDSLWTRHYIPLNWDPEGVAWILLRDIKSTPYNSYVSVGHASQLQPGLWRSWMIHVDSFGCLVPGCQNIVKTADLEKFNTPLPFQVYPNPFSDHIGILSTNNSFGNISIAMFDLNGKRFISKSIDPVLGYQYLIDTSNFPPGAYFLNFTAEHGNIIQTIKCVKY